MLQPYVNLTRGNCNDELRATTLEQCFTLCIPMRSGETMTPVIRAYAVSITPLPRPRFLTRSERIVHYGRRRPCLDDCITACWRHRRLMFAGCREAVALINVGGIDPARFNETINAAPLVVTHYRRREHRLCRVANWVKRCR